MSATRPVEMTRGDSTRRSLASQEGVIIEMDTTRTHRQCAVEEIPLGPALMRVMRALFFEEKALPELEALPQSQLRLLFAIGFIPDGTMKEFSERLCVSQSTVTQLADRLVRRGLVERSADPADRRLVRMHPSLVGRDILDRADRARRLTLEAVWTILTQEQRSEVVHGLHALGNAAESVREALGRPLLPWPPRGRLSEDSDRINNDIADTRQVVDLMARRVRGRSPSE